MIGRLHHVILDCPDPAALADFYAELLGLAFQLAPDHVPPQWPDPRFPQQVHLDVMVDDVDEAEQQVLALGARPLPGEHVYADLAGHPFCLIPPPSWGAP